MSYECHNQTKQYIGSLCMRLLHNVIFPASHDLQNCQQFSMSKLMWNKFSPSVTKCSKGVDNIDFAGSIVSNHSAWCKRFKSSS